MRDHFVGYLSQFKASRPKRFDSLRRVPSLKRRFRQHRLFDRVAAHQSKHSNKHSSLHSLTLHLFFLTPPSFQFFHITRQTNAVLRARGLWWLSATTALEDLFQAAMRRCKNHQATPLRPRKAQRSAQSIAHRPRRCGLIGHHEDRSETASSTPRVAW